ncbi:response regulator [soil metagenome]
MSESKKRALVVDDNPNNLMLERDLLEVAAFEVYVAEDATTGVAIAVKEIPDVIIMDVRLPDMRGPEAVRVIREYKETTDIPVVFVTASVMAEGLDEVKSIPNSIFISKPINTRTFAKEIIQFLTTKTALAVSAAPPEVPLPAH